MISLGCASSLLFNAAGLGLYFESPIDHTLSGLTFGLLFLYFAVDTKTKTRNFIARNEVFEVLNEHIFVLDTKGLITDINNSARKWLDKYNIKPDGKGFNTLLSDLRENGAVGGIDESKSYNEIFFPENDDSTFSSFSVDRQYIKDRQGVAIGSIISLTDITHMQETLRDLQEISSIDPLTGILNRWVYEDAIKTYDSPENLPLCIIMGDVNGLKYVNDTFGHIQGDALLKGTADILNRHCKDIGLVSRIGGDEFAIIVKNAEADAVERLIENIRKSFRDMERDLHGCTIALGYAMKSQPGENLKTIIEIADKLMYTDKDNDRRHRRKD
jgi:diguanylate cyclase (GGDEF)-like protein